MLGSQQLNVVSTGESVHACPSTVSGQKLDVALSDIKRAGFSDDVEVLGGGVLGVIDKSNWTVCEQEPAAGQAMTSTPRLKVDRTCASASPSAPPSPQQTAPPTASPLWSIRARVM